MRNRDVLVLTAFLPVHELRVLPARRRGRSCTWCRSGTSRVLESGWLATVPPLAAADRLPESADTLAAVLGER